MAVAATEYERLLEAVDGWWAAGHWPPQAHTARMNSARRHAVIAAISRRSRGIAAKSRRSRSILDGGVPGAG